ncbi:MAG: hypothetical protein HQL15_04430 [Candidatus Omnitrophica bacterium]|nr:hypothetical protein [Candidatus Omnitrophota bacterium]
MNILSRLALSIGNNVIPLIGVYYFHWDAMYTFQVYVIEYYILVLFDAIEVQREDKDILESLGSILLQGGAPILYIAFIPMFNYNLKFYPWLSLWTIASLLTAQYGISYISNLYLKHKIPQ